MPDDDPCPSVDQARYERDGRDTEKRLSWRRLTPTDVPDLAEWMAESEVARWWNLDATPTGIEREFGPSLRAEEPGEDLVVLFDNKPIGLLQRAVIADYPEDLAEFSAIVNVPEQAVQLDYLIGDPAFRRRGIGSRLVREVVEETWVSYPHAQAVLVAVVAANTASWRTLEAAGLHRIAQGPMTPDNPIDQNLHYVYRADRPGAASQTSSCPSQQ